MNKVLFADAAGPGFQKLYSQSHYALAALVPASLVSPSGSIPAKVADIGLAAAIPLHSHIAMNFGTIVCGAAACLALPAAPGPSVCCWCTLGRSRPPLTLTHSHPFFLQW